MARSGLSLVQTGITAHGHDGNYFRPQGRTIRCHLGAVHDRFAESNRCAAALASMEEAIEVPMAMLSDTPLHDPSKSFAARIIDWSAANTFFVCWRGCFVGGRDYRRAENTAGCHP
jgi:hypothetical protein